MVINWAKQQFCSMIEHYKEYHDPFQIIKQNQQIKTNPTKFFCCSCQALLFLFD